MSDFFQSAAFAKRGSQSKSRVSRTETAHGNATTAEILYCGKYSGWSTKTAGIGHKLGQLLESLSGDDDLAAQWLVICSSTTEVMIFYPDVFCNEIPSPALGRSKRQLAGQLID